MRTKFGFLSSRDTFAADLPQEMTTRSESSSTVVIDGRARSVQHSAASTPAAVFRGKARSSEASARGSRKVQLYRQASPDILFAYWKVADGWLWTQIDPVADGTSGLNRLLGEMLVYEDSAALPRIDMGSYLSSGNLREPAERDTVIFYSPDLGEPPASAPWSYTFRYAGAFAADEESGDADTAIVTRATSLGVTVACDGPGASLAQLRAAAGAAAASVEVVR
jgi:hypothetical protein